MADIRSSHDDEKIEDSEIINNFRLVAPPQPSATDAAGQHCAGSRTAPCHVVRIFAHDSERDIGKAFRKALGHAILKSRGKAPCKALGQGVSKHLGGLAAFEIVGL